MTTSHAEILLPSTTILAIARIFKFSDGEYRKRVFVTRVWRPDASGRPKPRDATFRAQVFTAGERKSRYQVPGFRCRKGRDTGFGEKSIADSKFKIQEKGELEAGKTGIRGSGFGERTIPDSKFKIQELNVCATAIAFRASLG